MVLETMQLPQMYAPFAFHL